MKQRRIQKKVELTVNQSQQSPAEREFEELYRESYSLVYNYIFGRMADKSSVEDVVAEAYLHAARSFSTYDPKRAKFSTWVTQIARNCMNDYYRKYQPAVALEDVPEHMFAQSGTQEELADRDLAEQLLRHLDTEERNLVMMKYRDGYRNVDIAKELGINASTVSTVLARALAKMRAIAEKGGADGRSAELHL